jgi:endogenous inhibitor of DNA gyrase (YacG/DUF329 family)
VGKKRRKVPSLQPELTMIAARCPICDRAIEGQGPHDCPEWPFCSPRCRLIDLGRWLGGDYRFPDAPAQDASPNEPGGSPKPAAPSAVPNREEA